MKKSIKILIIVILILAVLAGVAFLAVNLAKSKSNLPEINSAEELSALVDKVYEGLEIQMPMLNTHIVDVTDNMTVQVVTGLEDGSNFEYLVASEPLMSSQAYSFVLAKVKEEVNANEVAKAMNEKIDNRKWICVTAEKVYTTSSGNVVCLVMSNEETATTVYNKFKALAGGIGKEFERTEQEPELPADMY